MSPAPVLPPDDADVRPPLRYTLTIADPASQVVEVTVEIPPDQGAAVEMIMPVWSPGFYRREDYAARVQDIAARTADGAALQVAQTAPNRWRISPNDAPAIVLTPGSG